MRKKDIGRYWFSAKLVMPMGLLLSVLNWVIDAAIDAAHYPDKSLLHNIFLTGFYDVSHRLSMAAILLGFCVWIRTLTRRNNQAQEAAEAIAEELQEKTEELQKGHDELKFFAYSVMHDLKSLAVGIYGFSNKLHKCINRLDSRGKMYCDQIMRLAKHIASLVENINIFIKTREVPLTVERVSVKEILAMLCGEFSPQLEVRNITWHEPEQIPLIQADRISLFRIFRNLIDNALKYGGEKLSKISVSYSQTTNAHLFVFSDDGTGIPRDDQENVFEMFSRTETSKGTPGSGMGLAIVKEIVEKHGGEVSVESVPNKGTSFYLTFPNEL
jgi:signal transduction histidine kinase